MSVTYAGIPLTPSPFALAAVERWWHVHRIREVDDRSGQLGGVDHLPVPSQIPSEPPRVGVLYWPTGASRWATCHLLATGDQLARIQALSSAAPDLVFSDGANSVTAPMYRLAARPVSQRGDGKELYLLTLVDDRYYWWQAGDQAAPSAPASWSSLLTSLLSSVGVGSPTIDSIDADYGTPNASRWSVGYQPLPVLIDAACQTVGLRLVRSLAGDVSCVLYSTAATNDDARWTTHQYEVMAGGRAATSELARTAPASCAVVFLGSPDSETTKTLAGLSITEYGTETGIASKVGQVVADLPATAGATPRANYATQAATDYYLWQLSRTDATLRGVRVLETTGLEDACEWVWGVGEMVTRVVPSPRSDHNVYGYKRGHGARQRDASSPGYYVCPDDSAWHDPSFSTITLPRAGRYLIWGRMPVRTSASFLDKTSLPVRMAVRLYDINAGAVVPDNDAGSGGILAQASVPIEDPFDFLLCFTAIYDASGPNELRWEVISVDQSTTWQTGFPRFGWDGSSSILPVLGYVLID